MSPSCLSRADGSMKAIRVSVSVRPKRTLRSRLFGLVEGGVFIYSATVKSVGDEALGAEEKDPDSRITNLAAVEFVWAFPSGQVAVRRVPFPAMFGPGETYTSEEAEHQILSSGFALLHLRLWWTGSGLNLVVQDSAGQHVPIPDTLESAYLPEWASRASTTLLDRSFGSFRAKSRGEVYQSVLLLVAVVALVVNTFVALYNILK